MRKSKFNINMCFSHKKKVICHDCLMDVVPGKLYISLSMNSMDYGNPDFRIPLCKNCWDKLYEKSILEYENKKDKYGEYLKRRIVRSL